MISLDELSELVGSICDAGLNPARWPQVLDDVARSLGGMRADLWVGAPTGLLVAHALRIAMLAIVAIHNPLLMEHGGRMFNGLLSFALPVFFVCCGTLTRPEKAIDASLSRARVDS